MTHGNKKYEFEKLVNPGDSIEAETSNIYALKSSVRGYFKEPGITLELKKSFKFDEIGSGLFLVTRIK